ncbi:hypothetical protein NQ315_012987 [Exocentrus adspersus]|uniref:Uncharacterized protein n=1 Tax=Exocentrus adspersus TaxID=1586481 RepID=A0AAV8VRZ2_9CUCU|nr:hypothetical protein NQ315_012987 [Exocentrus adspersus]
MTLILAIAKGMQCFEEVGINMFGFGDEDGDRRNPNSLKHNLRVRVVSTAAHPRQARSEAESPAFRSTRTPEDSEPLAKNLKAIRGIAKPKGQLSVEDPEGPKNQEKTVPATARRALYHTHYRDKVEAFADSLELQCRENQIDDEDEEHTALVERRAR